MTVIVIPINNMTLVLAGISSGVIGLFVWSVSRLRLRRRQRSWKTRG